MAVIKYFGAVAEITQCTEEHIEVKNETLSDILEQLFKKYELQQLPIHIALNANLVSIEAETAIANTDEIALLPPFAGG
ncbi:MoaD/ThiS family protein [Mangrovimonas sp. DI 80]|uniref:MoaD/ThiS family protein n=1 Tax=Mangrovimonas sp. DI 80 TaxID=1779330 RepID=UPI00097651D9|nr:MoaD/ThiS family protein [Mangrovimonas sp. DI 80]OMP30544.1 hypothetical protein BKM32_09820 [Mangrovimonas sp. DI 80]